MSKEIFQKIESYVDYETGELKEQVKVIKKTIDRDEFMMVYLDSISSMLKIHSPIELKCLICLWSMSEFESNKVYIVKEVKQDIAEKTGYKFKTVENAISRLSIKNLLIRKSTSVYYLNPKYFFRGSDIARSQAIKLILEIEFNDDKKV